MSEPFLGQLALFPYNFAPANWLACEGQLLPISQNTALFSLLGTYYGGDGRTNFALPDLRGRVPNGMGHGPGLSDYPIGGMGGVPAVTLLSTQLAAHSHAFPAFASAATTSNPTGAQLAEAGITGRGATPINLYTAGGTSTPLANNQLQPTGQNGAHNNEQPSLVLTWCIAVAGIFPSRS